MATTKGTFTRVFAAYPLAIPAALGIVATLFPDYVAFDQASQRVTLTFTLTEIGAATAVGYGFVAAIFAKWGIKR